MTEAATNGTPGDFEFDLEQAKTAISSSSTFARITQLRVVAEKISHKCEPEALSRNQVQLGG
jgi:hypothetical protein